MRRSLFSEVLVVSIVVISFIAAASLSQQYGDALRGLVRLRGAAGLIMYVLITIAAVVIAPVSTLPLLPAAVTLWGAIAAALFSILGWWIGAMVAFFIAQRYGRPLVQKLVSLEKIARIERMLPSENLFWGVVLLRMAFPVDVLSYALGLFTPMRFVPYSLATLIGIAPFAFIFAYTATLPIFYELGAGILALIVMFLGYLKVRRRPLGGASPSHRGGVGV